MEKSFFWRTSLIMAVLISTVLTEGNAHVTEENVESSLETIHEVAIASLGSLCLTEQYKSLTVPLDTLRFESTRQKADLAATLLQDLGVSHHNVQWLRKQMNHAKGWNNPQYQYCRFKWLNSWTNASLKRKTFQEIVSDLELSMENYAFWRQREKLRPKPLVRYNLDIFLKNIEDMIHMKEYLIRKNILKIMLQKSKTVHGITYK